MVSKQNKLTKKMMAKLGGNDEEKHGFSRPPLDSIPWTFDAIDGAVASQNSLLFCTSSTEMHNGTLRTSTCKVHSDMHSETILRLKLSQGRVEIAL